MAIDFKKTKVSGHFPEIWRGECKILPAGFKPAQEFHIGTVLRRGTPIEVDFETRTAAVAKTVEVINGGTTTAPRVKKGHYFTVGDVVMKFGDGKKSPSIKSIDTTNDDFDIITLSAAITGLAEKDVIVESNEITSEVTEAKPLYTPNMVVGADLEFTGKGIPTIDAAFEAVVLYPSLNFPIIAEWITGCCLKANHNILFIKQ